jgi:hypothetical protein
MQIGAGGVIKLYSASTKRLMEETADYLRGIE